MNICLQSLVKFSINILFTALQRHLVDKSIKTRQCCFTLLSNLVTTMPGCLANHLSTLMNGIKYSLSTSRNNSSNIKIDVLEFLHILLVHHEAEVFVILFVNQQFPFIRKFFEKRSSNLT